MSYLFKEKVIEIVKEYEFDIHESYESGKKVNPIIFHKIAMIPYQYKTKLADKFLKKGITVFLDLPYKVIVKEKTLDIFRRKC
jgi:hypothetical protein